MRTVPSSAAFGELLRHKTIKPFPTVIQICHVLSIKKPMCFLMTSWNWNTLYQKLSIYCLKYLR